jgi:hypothetical protein
MPRLSDWTGSKPFSMATINEFQARKEASSIPDRNEHLNVQNAFIFFLYLFMRNDGSPSTDMTGGRIRNTINTMKNKQIIQIRSETKLRKFSHIF